MSAHPARILRIYDKQNIHLDNVTDNKCKRCDKIKNMTFTTKEHPYRMCDECITELEKPACLCCYEVFEHEELYKIDSLLLCGPCQEKYLKWHFIDPFDTASFLTEVQSYKGKSIEYKGTGTREDPIVID